MATILAVSAGLAVAVFVIYAVQAALRSELLVERLEERLETVERELSNRGYLPPESRTYINRRSS